MPNRMPKNTGASGPRYTLDKSASELRIAALSAAGPAADTQIARIAQAAVGKPRPAARAVRAEDAFVHIGDLAAIHIHDDLEARPTVLTEELAHVVYDAVRHIQCGCRIDLRELVFSRHTGDARHVHRSRRFDGERILTDIRPAEVLDVAAVIEVHAVHAVVS